MMYIKRSWLSSSLSIYPLVLILTTMSPSLYARKISSWGWQEKYSQWDIQNQNTPMYKIPMPFVSSSPWEISKSNGVGCTLIDSMQICKPKIQRSLVRCNPWCLGCTVEHPSSNVVYDRKDIPSNKTVLRELVRQHFIVAYWVLPCLEKHQMKKCTQLPKEMLAGGRPMSCIPSWSQQWMHTSSTPSSSQIPYKCWGHKLRRRHCHALT